MRMKSINDFTNEKITELFDTIGCFYAFTVDQFNKKKKDGIEYASLGCGLIVPKDKAQYVVDEMDRIHKYGIEQMKANYSADDIILYELKNHECFYLCDYSPIIDIMAEYGYTVEQIRCVFNQNYHLVGE